MLRRSYMQTDPPDLPFEDHKTHVQGIIDAAMLAASPANALVGNWPLAMKYVENCYVVGGGKAALGMALKLEELLEGRLLGGAVSVVPTRLEALDESPASFEVFPTAHPLPDERNIKASRRIAEIADKAGEGDTVIAVISGGGSSMLTLPVDGITLDDLRLITEQLQRAGAPVTELNIVRKHCEQLKGGQLARLAHPAKVWAFILSDVVGDSLNVIASGLTAADPSTYQDALDVLAHYGILDDVPAVRDHLLKGVRGEVPETVKPGDEALAHVTNMLIGTNRLALEAARRHSIEKGWKVVGFEFGVEGEARIAGMRLALMAQDILNRPDRPACYLMGGETTVTVHGDGDGGRNQELALAAAIALDGVERIAVASFATDGVDGQSNAAGAIVTGQTVARARELGLNPEEYLNNNNSYEFFQQVGGLIDLGGPTGTNVNDISVALVY